MIEIKRPHPQIESWSEGDCFHLDVRKLLEDGGEPFSIIMDCLHQFEPGSSLVLHALFEPKPLIPLVKDMGFDVAVERVDPEHWTVTITQSREQVP